MVEQIPIKESVLFDLVEQDPVYFNVTENQAYVFGSILVGVAGVGMLATTFLLIVTFFSTAMDGMKLCEKLLVYNVLVPDFVLEFFILYFIGPASWANYYQQGLTDTRWLAYLHTVCLFHSQLATATICYVIALSMTDAYKFEMANDMKHMSVVVMSTVVVTLSFCSLPAIEDRGYAVLIHWLGPSFDIHFQYGSLFMCLGVMGLVAIIELRSLYKLIEARKLYQEYKARISKRALEELEQEVIFCILSLFCAGLLIPVIIGVRDPFLMFLPRLLAYVCPVLRVIFLLASCPHFHFNFFRSTEGGDDFAAIEHLGDGTAGIQFKKQSKSHELQSKFEETYNLTHSTTEL